MALRAVNDAPPTVLDTPIPGDFYNGLPVACGRIAGALQVLLKHPDSPVVRRLAQEAFDSYREWYDRTTGATG